LRILLLLFIIVPIVEMWVLITVGQHIGALPTIGLVLLTAFIGVSLLRYQGAAALLTARAKMSSGELPARELADGLFFAVGGALLLTPGFVTDIIGFACLTPGIRTVLIGFLAKHLFKGRFQTQGNYSQAFSQERSFGHTESYKASSSRTTSIVEGDLIEGDFERDFERDKD
jgi:UPF0716 protein FxsA